MRPRRMARKVQKGYRIGQRMARKARREATRPRNYRPRSTRRGCLFFPFV